MELGYGTEFVWLGVKVASVYQHWLPSASFVNTSWCTRVPNSFFRIPTHKRKLLCCTESLKSQRDLNVGGGGTEVGIFHFISIEDGQRFIHRFRFVCSLVSLCLSLVWVH